MLLLDCDDDDPTLNLDDADADGASTCEGDCDDGDPTVHPLDLDGDGVSTCDPVPDCDDANAAVGPALAEVWVRVSVVRSCFDSRGPPVPVQRRR